MKTFHLQLVPDKELPQFKRLQYTEVDISFTEAMKKGIHIRHDDTEQHSAMSNLQNALTHSEEGLSEIAALGYAEKISTDGYMGFRLCKSKLLYLLNRMTSDIYFVDSLSYQELLQAAHERLLKIWSDEVAETILKARYTKFDELRMFLKTKSQDLKLQGYGDLKTCGLSKLLTPQDFRDAEKLVIHHGLECHTFRPCSFLSRIVNEDGLLLSHNGNTSFLITYIPDELKKETIVPYHCSYQDGTVRFTPGLNTTQQQRHSARDIAAKWRRDEGKYCFQTDLQQVEKMLESNEYCLSFCGSQSLNSNCAVALQAMVKPVDVKRFRIGKLFTCSSINADIKTLLKEHDLRVSGRKEALLERLNQLCVEQYSKHEEELSEYFTHNRFIRIQDENAPITHNLPYYAEVPVVQHNTFPLLQNHSLQNQLLAMFVLRHLRGNVILDTSYCNDTCSLQELARGLTNEDVKMCDVYLRVA